MNIVANKFYRTRDGRKAKVYAVGVFAGGTIHGAILTAHDNDWRVWEWTASGQTTADGPSKDDLVDEWVDPPPRLYGWVATKGPREGEIIMLPDGKLPKSVSDFRRAEWINEPEVMK